MFVYDCILFFFCVMYLSTDTHVLHFAHAGNRHRELAQLTVLLSPLVNWFGLGLQLGIYYYELKKIDLGERGSVNRCLEAVLQRWLNEEDDVKTFGGATKEKLMSALKDIEENALSETIAQATLGDFKAFL